MSSLTKLILVVAGVIAFGVLGGAAIWGDSLDAEGIDRKDEAFCARQAHYTYAGAVSEFIRADLDTRQQILPLTLVTVYPADGAEHLLQAKLEALKKAYEWMAAGQHPAAEGHGTRVAAELDQYAADNC